MPIDCAFACARDCDVENQTSHAFELLGDDRPQFQDWESRYSESFSTKVISLSDRPLWLHGGLRALNRLANLKNNWDSYGAEAPSRQAVRTARHIVGILGDFDVEPYSIDPSVEGGVCISFARGNRYGDIECFNTRELCAVVSEENETPLAWDVSESDEGIAVAIQRICEFIGA